MLINQNWHDVPNYYTDDLPFQGDFTACRFKRVIKSGEQVGLLLDIYLKPQARNLPYEDIQMIFLLNERTLMNMVPNKVELQILKDPINKAWMMRPEARLPNLQSQLSSSTHDPN